MKTLSSAPDSIIAANSVICTGTTVTLTISGGMLGTGGDWYWYSNSCGGQEISKGTTLFDNPTVTTDYYVRAESICNISNCVVKTIFVNNPSTVPDSITASSSTICAGSWTTLVISGGNLGTNAEWYWYSGSCGGTFEGTGTILYASPTVTTDYYIRAEGYCDTTNCLLYTINLYSSTTPVDSIIAAASTICPGLIATLSISGGSLVTNANWTWYNGLCGGTFEGTGATIYVSPTTFTTYFVRGEGTCNTTACSNISIYINSISYQADSIISSSSTICPGSMVTLSISGGTLGTGADWYWYSGTCGGQLLGNGSSLSITPSVSSSYWVKAVGDCNGTSCVNKYITVDAVSVSVDSIATSNSSVCAGTSTILGVAGGMLGTGALWYWYSGSCGGQFKGSGVFLTVTPSITTCYYVRAEGNCSTTTCNSKTISIKSISSVADSINITRVPSCAGDTATLVSTGGNLGSGGNWHWYSISCGGTLTGMGTTLIVNPVVSTTYFVRAEDVCTTTSCVSKSIIINSPSVSPVSNCHTCSNLYRCGQFIKFRRWNFR